MTPYHLLGKVQIQIWSWPNPNFQPHLYLKSHRTSSSSTGILLCPIRTSPCSSDITPTFPLCTFVQNVPATYNLSLSLPLWLVKFLPFKDWLKCHFLWENLPGYVISHSPSPSNILDLSCDIYTVLPSITAMFTLAWDIHLLSLPWLEILKGWDYALAISAVPSA